MRTVWPAAFLAACGLAAGCGRPAVPSGDAGASEAVRHEVLAAAAPTAARVHPGTFRRFYDGGRPGLDADWRPDAPERTWDAIVLHHTATGTGSVAAIDAAHRRRTDAAGRPWQGIGYHFVIGNGNGMADGAIEPTFRWKRQLDGAHAGDEDYNRRGIGVALVGDFDGHLPTPAQVAAVTRLVAALRETYGIGRDRVVGHDTIKATGCPGRLFPLEQVAGR